MPRFFFHYRQGHALSPDEEGSEFVDAEAAYDGAYTGAVDLWTDLLRESIDPRVCAFEVADHEGRQIFTLPFGDVLEPRRRGPRFVKALTERLP